MYLSESLVAGPLRVKEKNKTMKTLWKQIQKSMSDFFSVLFYVGSVG